MQADGCICGYCDVMKGGRTITVRIRAKFVKWALDSTGQAFLQLNTHLCNFIEISKLIRDRWNYNGNAKRGLKKVRMGFISTILRQEP